MKYQLHTGNNIDVLKTYPDNHFDSIVTDPPYGIDFLGKDWDANTGALETYQECLRVLKPGGHILAFSAARTYHHLAITLEKAGFEIRDQIMWIYSSGFPKAQDVGKQIQKQLGVKETKKRILNQFGGIGNQIDRESGINYKDNKQRETVIEEVIVTDPLAQQWEGWKSALKPAHEPIALARKPIKGSIVKNVQQWGTGALNIDATRIKWDEGKPIQSGKVGTKETFNNSLAEAKGVERSNFNKDEEEWVGNDLGRYPSNVLGEISDYQKYFYCPKVSRKERHVGFDESAVITQSKMIAEMGGHYIDSPRNTSVWLPQTGNIYVHGLKHEYEKWKIDNKTNGNNHPTVKPVELMKYLITLITPPNGKVLDPFNGSGSTGMAATELGHEYVGIDLDAKYIAISEQRIIAWNTEETVDVIDEPTVDNTVFETLFE